MTYELLPGDVERVRQVLIDLIDRSEADSCIVCDQAGHVLASENAGEQDPLLISALGAGVFVATKELARILGEDEFSTVLHQGAEKSILIASATEEVLLVVMFSGENKVGLVKLYTPAATAALRRIFADVTSRDATTEKPDRHFVLKDTANIFGGSSGS